MKTETPQRAALVEWLGNIAEATNPWSPQPTEDCFDDRFTQDQINAELAALVEEGLIQAKDDPHYGMKQYAPNEALFHPDYLAEQSDYAELKESVVIAAKAKGYGLKWREGEGWTLRSKTGEVLQYGPMRDIARFLSVAKVVSA